jgi:hypothetical protein
MVRVNATPTSAFTAGIFFSSGVLVTVRMNAWVTVAVLFVAVSVTGYSPKGFRRDASCHRRQQFLVKGADERRGLQQLTHVRAAQFAAHPGDQRSGDLTRDSQIGLTGHGARPVHFSRDAQQQRAAAGQVHDRARGILAGHAKVRKQPPCLVIRQRGQRDLVQDQAPA